MFRSEFGTPRSRVDTDARRFSSNVVEKCIRVADPEVRRGLVEEVLDRSKLEKLLRDSYGNYVIQTILDYCEMKQRVQVSRARSAYSAQRVLIIPAHQ